MGMTRDTNDILNRPPVLLSPHGATERYAAAGITQSATSSLTAISIQGPGVMNFLSLTPGTDQKGTIKLFIDGVTAFSLSGAFSPTYMGAQLIGQIEQVGNVYYITLFEEIAFENSFLCMYEFPEHSSDFSVTIRYAYRLTE